MDRLALVTVLVAVAIWVLGIAVLICVRSADVAANKQRWFIALRAWAFGGVVATPAAVVVITISPINLTVLLVGVLIIFGARLLQAGGGLVRHWLPSFLISTAVMGTGITVILSATLGA